MEERNMKNIITILSTSLLLIGCGEQPGLKDTLGDSWRFLDSNEAELASWGIRTVISPTENKFDRHGLVQNSDIIIKISKPLEVKYDSIKSAKTELTQNQIGHMGITYKDTIDSGFTVIKSSIANKERLVTTINEEIGTTNVEKWNADSVRIITAIATVSSHKQIKDLNISFNGDINAIKKINGTIVASASNSQKTISKYDDGSIVAYQYARLCWNQNGNLVYIQEEAPNHFLFAWFNRFDCPEGTLIKRPL